MLFNHIIFKPRLQTKFQPHLQAKREKCIARNVVNVSVLRGLPIAKWTVPSKDILFWMIKGGGGDLGYAHPRRHHTFTDAFKKIRFHYIHFQQEHHCTACAIVIIIAGKSFKVLITYFNRSSCRFFFLLKCAGKAGAELVQV